MNLSLLLHDRKFATAVSHNVSVCGGHPVKGHLTPMVLLTHYCFKSCLVICKVKTVHILESCESVNSLSDPSAFSSEGLTGT